MSTETAVAVWTPPGLPTKDEFDTMRSMAMIVAKSSAVRDCFRGNPDNCFVAISVGREIGIPPTLALSKGYVIDGGFQLEADVLGDVVRRNVPGLSWEVTEMNDKQVTVTGGIQGGRVHTVTFTFEMAVAAGWTEGRNGLKNQWKPGARQDTMYAKCIRRLVKRTGGLWASLYSVDADEAVVDNSSPPVKHEPSSAAVVIDGERVGEFAPATSGVEKPVATPAEPKKVEHPGEDWQYRLLMAFAQATRLHSNEYKERLGDPPSKQPGRTRWAKANGEELMRTVNAYYAERGFEPIKSWALFPPLDAEKVALWLEERNTKRAGNAGQDAPVAQDEPPARNEEPNGEPADPTREPGAGIEPGEQAAIGFDAAPPPPAPEPEKPSLSEQTEALASGTLDDALRALDELKARSKGARRYYEIDPKTGDPYLKDGEFLVDLGYVQEVTSKTGERVKAPVSQWLKTVWAKDADRVMLARRIIEALNAEVTK